MSSVAAEVDITATPDPPPLLLYFPTNSYSMPCQKK